MKSSPGHWFLSPEQPLLALFYVFFSDIIIHLHGHLCPPTLQIITFTHCSSCCPFHFAQYLGDHSIPVQRCFILVPVVVFAVLEMNPQPHSSTELHPSLTYVILNCWMEVHYLARHLLVDSSPVSSLLLLWTVLQWVFSYEHHLKAIAKFHTFPQQHGS